MTIRLKLKVYTDPYTKKRYVAAAGMLDPATGVIHAVLLSDDDTRPTKMLVSEWNDLPYFYFVEGAPAEKPEKKWDPAAGKEAP